MNLPKKINQKPMIWKTLRQTFLIKPMCNFLKIILLTYFLLFFQISFGQNLIPNPSLEDENTCQKYHEQCAPKAWRSNTLKAFLYFDYRISTQDETVIQPADGNRCISLRMFNTHRKADRSFVQVPFLCQLEKGKKYKLQFQMMSSTYFVNSFEVLFLDTMEVVKKNDPLFETKPQVKFEFKKPFSPNKWMTLETIYEATGDEVGMMLGNFKRDEATVITLLRKRKRREKQVRRVYHYFDNFSLTPLDSLENGCDLEKNKQYIYKDSVRHSIAKPPHSVQNIEALEEVVLLDTIPVVIPEKEIISQLEEFVEDEKFILPDVLFEKNSDQLLPVAYRSLDELIVFLEKNKTVQLKIIGHTDNIGKEYKNQVLSENRAKSVVNYLIVNGIPISRIQAQGKGETQPIAPNDTFDGRQLNRRVEFFIYRR